MLGKQSRGGHSFLSAQFLAVLAGLLTFIPNIKPILEAVPPILLGNMQSPTAALYVFVLYLAIQSIESYLITPLTACGLVLVKMLYVEDVLGDSTDIQSADDSNN